MGEKIWHSLHPPSLQGSNYFVILKFILWFWNLFRDSKFYFVILKFISWWPLSATILIGHHTYQFLKDWLKFQAPQGNKPSISKWVSYKKRSLVLNDVLFIRKQLYEIPASLVSFSFDALLMTVVYQHIKEIEIVFFLCPFFSFLLIFVKKHKTQS